APEVLDLPADRPRPSVRSSRGTVVPMAHFDGAGGDLARLARREGATTFMVLLAVFETLLYRASGQEVFLVGTPIANRGRAETESLMGFFVNTLVLRADLAGDPAFSATVQRVREGTLEAYEHQDVPFEKLVEELRPGRSLSHTPLFQVMFIAESGVPPALALPGLAVSPLAVDSGTAKFDLTLALTETGDGLGGEIE